MNDLKTTLLDEFEDAEYAHAYCDEFLNTYIATQLKVLREQRGWTQGQVAELADMKQTRISVLEDINYSSWSVKTLRRLARAFDLRLKVSFEDFSTIIDDICLFSRLNLQRSSRAFDIARAKTIIVNQPGGAVADIASWGKKTNKATQYEAPGIRIPSSELLGLSSERQAHQEQSEELHRKASPL